MRKQELELLGDIGRIEQQQSVLLERARSPQEEFLQCFGQRFLVGRKMLHKNVELALGYLEGSFAQLALQDAYLSFTLDNRLDVAPDNFNVLKMLISWTDYFPTLRSLPTLELTEAIFQGGDVSAFSSLEELVSYINFISPDLLKLFRRKENPDSSHSAANEADRYSLERVGAEELLSFLNVALPKAVFNILLTNDMLPAQLKKGETFECLFKNRSLEFFMRSKQGYANLMRVLVRGATAKRLKSGQQRLLMEVAFRYFYVYHHDKRQAPTEIFAAAYNCLDESTRFSLADEFILFFRIIRKLGKGRFADFLAEKAPWVREITSKINEKSIVGYQKDNVKPFNPLEITDIFVVENGKKVRRYFEVFEDFSLFYFKIDVVSLDVTIRLFYLGEVEAEKGSETLLIEKEKKSGEFANSIMATRRGLYAFEFDNSYSWINSKTIRFENIVFSPLEIKSVAPSKWLPAFFNAVPTNEAVADRVVLIQRVAERKQERGKEYSGSANITKSGPFLNLKITKPNHIYEFETENEEVFVRRFSEFVDSANLMWTVNGEPLEDTDDLRQVLSGDHIKDKEAPKAEKAKEATPKLSLQEFKEEQ